MPIVLWNPSKGAGLVAEDVEECTAFCHFLKSTIERDKRSRQAKPIVAGDWTCASWRQWFSVGEMNRCSPGCKAEYPEGATSFRLPLQITDRDSRGILEARDYSQLGRMILCTDCYISWSNGLPSKLKFGRGILCPQIRFILNQIKETQGSITVYGRSTWVQALCRSMGQWEEPLRDIVSLDYIPWIFSYKVLYCWGSRDLIN